MHVKPNFLFFLSSLLFSSLNEDGKKAGVHQGGAASTFRGGTKKMDLTEAYDILGVTDKTPWPEVVKVRHKHTHTEIEKERKKERKKEKERLVASYFFGCKCFTIRFLTHHRERRGKGR